MGEKRGRMGGWEGGYCLREAMREARAFMARQVWRERREEGELRVMMRRRPCSQRAKSREEGL